MFFDGFDRRLKKSYIFLTMGKKNVIIIYYDKSKIYNGKYL